MRQSNAAHGLALPQTKLMPLDVAAIREAARLRLALRRRITATLSNAALADKFRTSDMAIVRAIHGHVTAGLSMMDVAQIQASRLHRERLRALVDESLSNKALAVKFDVQVSTIESALSGRTHWRA